MSLLPRHDRREGDATEANDAPSDEAADDVDDGASNNDEDDDSDEDDTAPNDDDDDDDEEEEEETFSAAAAAPAIDSDEDDVGPAEERRTVMLAEGVEESGSDASISGSSDEESEEDLMADVEAFLDPFQPRDEQHNIDLDGLQHEAIVEVPNKSHEFLCLCIDVISAPKNRKKNSAEAQKELLYWMKLSDVKCPMAYMTRNRLQTYADEMGVGHIPMLQRDAMIDRIVTALTSSDNDVGDEGDDLETALYRALLVGSIMKPLPDGKEEGQSKYTTAGQRVEGPALKKWGKSARDFVQAIYQPGLVQANVLETDGDYNDDYSFRNAVRTSADGVVMFNDSGIKETGNVLIPAEVKARVTPNTFHKTRQRFSNEKEHSLADMPGIGGQTHNKGFDHYTLTMANLKMVLKYTTTQELTSWCKPMSIIIPLVDPQRIVMYLEYNNGSISQKVLQTDVGEIMIVDAGWVHRGYTYSDTTP